ncbi:hypothetical protein Patl1_04450 [Pistacia atlantica]|uniref:Uncharacterized protein n=1 Tax=Pistacia atlantica TaxID=434234 RepID=A0ACC1BWG0_9ROSI|nr:hypothetical protein Patl1_04450 [Pistacia atlantica]
MAMREVAAQRGLRRLFSTSPFPSFNLPPTAAAAEQPKAEPSTNLFVSGNKANCISDTKRENYSGSLKCLSKRTPQKAISAHNNSFSGLSKHKTTEGLKEAFSKFGEVVQARVVTDQVSGYSKGFGFLRYATLEDTAKGIEGMDGKVS